MTKIVLWVSDLDAQTSFYMELLDAVVGEESDGFRQLISNRSEILLHELPEPYKLPVPLTQATPAQEEVAIKPVFPLISIEAAMQRVKSSLAVFAKETTVFAGQLYQDVIDPEGNVIQLEQQQ
jgi:catechol 2,3-dioxygenase-like lactoylglutathione lyase family enzyme